MGASIRALTALLDALDNRAFRPSDCSFIGAEYDYWRRTRRWRLITRMAQRRCQCEHMADEAADPAIWSQLLACRNGKAEASSQIWPGIWSLYAPIVETSGPFVLGQLGQSLDGRIATPTGHSRTISGTEAIAHLHRLRALSDAVVVGIGTVLADDPQLTVREVEGPSPVRVVIDPNGRLPEDARVLADDGIPCIAVQAGPRARPSRMETLSLPAADGQIDVRGLVNGLAARGLRRLLIEGGGKTVSAFLAAEALNRLHVCVTPVVIGSGPTGLCLPPIAKMDEAMRRPCTIHRIGDDVLFDLAMG
jgi:diaminohydroxyphosphoribosylaminopyrimidine deaminase/5-amino-6-(5-phosphoribosylamino)uracil reductase